MEIDNLIKQYNTNTPVKISDFSSILDVKYTIVKTCNVIKNSSNIKKSNLKKLSILIDNKIYQIIAEYLIDFINVYILNLRGYSGKIMLIVIIKN